MGNGEKKTKTKNLCQIKNSNPRGEGELQDLTVMGWTTEN